MSWLEKQGVFCLFSWWIFLRKTILCWEPFVFFIRQVRLLRWDTWTLLRLWDSRVSQSCPYKPNLSGRAGTHCAALPAQELQRKIKICNWPCLTLLALSRDRISLFVSVLRTKSSWTFGRSSEPTSLVFFVTGFSNKIILSDLYCTKREWGESCPVRLGELSFWGLG